MPIVGITLTAVEGRKKEAQGGGEINVNTTPRITDVKEVSMAMGKALSMGFEFVTSYTPDIGEIKMQGNVLFVGEKNPEILKQWKKDQTLPDEVSVQVLNYLFRRCLIKISTLADDIQLPPPLQIPLVKAKEAEQKAS